MTEGKVVLLFPGQGAFDGEPLRAAHREHPEVARVFASIDRVAEEFFGRSLSPVLFGPRPIDIADLLRDDPWVSQLAIYGSDLAAHEVLAAQGLRPDVLVGHSLGEIAALVAAGAYSVEDGARVVAHRVLAVQSTSPDGYLAALTTSRTRAQLLVELVGDPLVAVAAENDDRQVVISGASAGMDTVQVVALHLGIASVRLHSPFPFHSPVLRPAVGEFADRVRGLPRQRMDVRVYSPILRRYYDEADVLPDLLAAHLVQPVAFADALRRVHADGGRVFVECGALTALTKLVGSVVPHGTTVLATFARGAGGGLALTTTLADLRAGGLLKGESVRRLAETLAPGVDPEVFARFWARNRAEIAALIADRVDAFTADGPAPAPVAAQAPPPMRLVALPAEPPEPQVVKLAAVPTAAVDRENLLAEVRSVYATALEYPEEVFTDDVLLEAELGVDSVKQIELMTRVATRYGISEQAQGVRLADYDTMGKVVDFVHAAIAEGHLDYPVAATK
ncbi:acyltransferase domain-containing protein [Umezawaea sp. Da 62-37]|uniref:acyltransferase domain-containing protein n=1 Tax=Umezawaea sp. Da 62-37 TaxID=3075927 RepID=UPI0028F74129|nr:acyltransferase domain-containing protein [Umezawaea sp. Da 62-37]WNV84501.1 acyltransferase domain-containing protein [Umezawaea sp. Da 62-37]